MPAAEKLFEAMIRQHAEMLTVYLRASLGPGADVDDVFQETMIVAWRRLDDFDQTRPFGPWLRGIARNLVLAQYRKRTRSGHLCSPIVLDQLDARLEQFSQRSGDTWQEKLELLQGCVSRLPETYRHAIQQRYYERESVQQVATTLKLSVAAVKKRLQRGRALVLDCINGQLATET